jgi:DNA invertase Pin-like site-specific DNA recombinase
MGMVYGYIRVSTKDQNGDRQILALKGLSIPEKNLFIDKQSGKDFERPQYWKIGAKAEKRRSALYQEYRPSGAKLF